MEEDIAGHGSKPLIQKAQEEGIYASLMSTTNMIVRRLDQGLTLPPKIHLETLTDNGESHKESTSKEQATKDSTSEARDRHLKDDLSQENAGNNGCMNETQQEHTGKVYDPCQHIQPILHHRQENLTDGPSGFSVLGQKQLGFCSSSQAPDRALKLVPEHRLARTQSAGCQGNIDEERANQLQLARTNENIPSVCPMGDRAMPGSSRPSQDTVTRTQRSKGSDVGLLCSRECTTAIEQPVVTSQQTDDLPYRGIRGRGQELTLSLGSMVKKRLSGSELSCATLRGVVNKGDGKATGNVSAPEQLQDEKSQDEKLQYEQPQDKIHTSGQVPASMVEEGTKRASGVSCGVESPKAKGVEARLYSPIYKSPKANASSQVNTTIAATIRNRPASKHISATLQHRSLSTLYSSHPQLIALRSYIATAPLPSPGVRKIQQLILSAIDGEIELEGNPGLDTQLDAIFHRMAADEKFQNGVIGFGMSKLGHSVTENDAGFSNQSFGLGANTTASKAPISIFNIKTCTLEELKEEYNAIKAIAKKDHQLLLNSDFKCNSLEKDAKALKQECDHWKTISSSVPGAKTAADQSTKWMCTSCGLLNDSWADLTEWAPAKAPRVARHAPEEAGIPESRFTWAPTEYCKYCGRHKSGGRPQQSAKSPSKRKLANVAMGPSIANNGEQSDEQIKRHCCKNMMSEIKSDASGRAAPTTQTYQDRFLDSPATAPDAQLPQVPLANQDMANIQQGHSSGGNYSANHLPNVSGIVSDQHCFPSINGTVPNQQIFPNGNDTVAGQQYFPTDNATTGGQQFFPIGNGTIGDQQYFPAGNGVVRDQQHSPNSSGTITSQQSSPSGSGTITYQQSPSITGTDTSQNYLPSTNGSITNQQFVPNSFDMYTDQFAGEGEFFSEFFDFDAAGESQDRFRATDWRGGIDLLNAGVATSATSATPNTSSPDQTTLPFPSATPPSGGNSYQSLIGFDDDINSISPEDLNLFHSIQNDQADQATAKTSAKPQSKAQSKIAKPGVKYDMRGNQIGPSTLPTIRNRKPMAPRTAKVGVLTFPTSAAPKNAASETTQHPNGG